MPYALLTRGGRGFPWSLIVNTDDEGNDKPLIHDDKEWVRGRRNSILGGGLSPECLKVLEVSSTGRETVESEIASLNRSEGSH